MIKRKVKMNKIKQSINKSINNFFFYIYDVVTKSFRYKRK